MADIEKENNLFTWDWAFRETVLGLPSDYSCILNNGKLELTFDPIKKGAPQNPKLIADLLRSGQKIPAYIMDWIADLFDSEVEGDYKIKHIPQNGKGAKKVGGDSSNWDLAYAYEELKSSGKSDKVAIIEVQEKFGNPSKSKIRAAVQSLKDAKIEHDRVIREENA